MVVQGRQAAEIRAGMWLVSTAGCRCDSRMNQPQEKKGEYSHYGLKGEGQIGLEEERVVGFDIEEKDFKDVVQGI